MMHKDEQTTTPITETPSITQPCPQSNIQVLQGLVRINRHHSKLDGTKTLFFKLGVSKVFTSSVYVYLEEEYKFGRPKFCDIVDPSEAFPCQVNFNSQLMQILTEAREEFDKIGWIVMTDTRWGFLLNLASLEPVYEGVIPPHWEKLLRYPFFAEEFIKYAYYNHDLVQQDGNNQIPSTEFDPVISSVLCPIHDILFYHQKQEVGWMFKLEKNPALKVPFYTKSIPFLDTGLFIDSETKSISGTEDKNGIETTVPSGILASQVGSGKTVSMIALMSIGTVASDEISHVVRNLEAENNLSSIKENNKKKEQEEFKIEDISRNLDEVRALLNITPKPSLVIVTKNILYQWQDEFRKFAPNLRVFFLENMKDIANLEFEKGADKEVLLSGYDVILTHRKIIEEGNHSFKELCPLIHQVQFARIIIDEVHELITLWDDQIKGVKSKNVVQEKIYMAEFYSCLSALRRQFTWGMTGTPNNLNFQNQAGLLFKILNLQDVFSQLNVYLEFKTKFLKHHVRANPCHLNLPYLHKTCKQVRFGQLQNLIYQVKLNYAMNVEEARIACSQMLPQYDLLDKEEATTIHNAVAMIYQKHQDEIDKVNYKLIQNPGDKRLEQRLKALQEENNFYLEMIELLKQETIPCPICICDVGIKELVVTNCVHSLCVDCFSQLNRNFGHPMCPICRQYMMKDQLILHPDLENNKSNKLMEILNEIKKVPENDKIIIFTQFHTLVEKLEVAFTHLGVKYMILKGQPSEISISLRKFEAEAEIKILLMSVEQAASGINITVANHVFFAHPIFGDSLEKTVLTYNQCIGRVYRIGQRKQVQARMFVTAGSLEEPLQQYFLRQIL